MTKRPASSGMEEARRGFNVAACTDQNKEIWFIKAFHVEISSIFVFALNRLLKLCMLHGEFYAEEKRNFYIHRLFYTSLLLYRDFVEHTGSSLWMFLQNFISFYISRSIMHSTQKSSSVISELTIGFIRIFINLARSRPLCIICVYLCFLRAAAEQQSAPHFVVQPSFSGGIVTENQSKILQCQAIGFPPPQYRWLKDGHPLGNYSHDPLLRISKIAKVDSGEYQCIAQNEVGAVFSEKTALTVAYINDPVSQTNSTITVRQGEAAVLVPPEVESVPLPTVTWQRIGHGRLHGSKYVVTVENHLVILSTDLDDSGQYQALLTNTQVGQEKSSGIITLVVEANSNPVSPKIIIPPKNTTFIQGTFPAALECIANARPLEDIVTIWKKDERELQVTNPSYLHSPWNRTLTIINVGPSHEGQYECIIESKAGGEPIKASATVSVHVPPTVIHQSSGETVSEIGKTISLTCNVVGSPPPVIKWYRNAILINSSPGEHYHVSDEGILQIDNLHMDDSGIFQCVAKNRAGEVSTSTWLHVKTSPPVFYQPPENVTVLDGKDVQIICEAGGAPTPNISWMFNDTTIIHSAGRIQILDSGSLLIASAESSDIGKYTCTRTNSAGTVSGYAYLQVLVRTQIIQPPVHTKVILSSTAEMQCKVSHDANVPYSVVWYFGNKELKFHPGGRIQVLPDNTLRIGQARNTDVGTYTCQVISPGGNETRSAKLNVIELPHPPANVRAILLNTQPKSVNVSWSRAFDGNSPITSYVVQKRAVPSSDVYLESLIPWVTAKGNISGMQRCTVLNDLKPASSYQFRVSAVNGVGEGNPSPETEVITLPSQPPSGPPQGVVGGSRSPVSIMLQWQPPAEEDRNGELLGYKVRYKLAGYTRSPWAYHDVNNEAQHSLLLQDLIVWQNYEVQVAAYNEKGDGVFSESIYIRTREGIPQAAPTEVRADAMNSTSVRVRWKPPDPQLINGINQGYKVQAWLSSPQNDTHPIHTVSVAPSPLDPEAMQETIIKNLEKFTTYNITVLCFTSPGDGPRSEPVLVTTAQDIPDVVSSLKFEDILDTSVKVLWGPPRHVNGILLGYTLKYHVKDVPETTVVRNMTAEVNEVLIDNLRPVTAYSFRICAWTVVGPGPPRIAVIQSGIPPVLPSPPNKLAVSNIGAFSVVLQFTPGFDGNSSIIKWLVEGQTRRNDTWFRVYEVSDPDATTLTVYGLTPFTEYKLRLLAVNVVGSSGPSDPTKFFQTIQAPPSHPPYNVTLRAVNANAIRVRWTPLQQVEWYGIPRGYNISYRPLHQELQSYQFEVLEDHNSNSYVLKNLEEFTEYEVFVQAYNDVGSSSPSPLAVESTRESVPSLGPSDVTANATSSTTIVVKWSEVPKIDQNGIIEGYKVHYGAKMVPFKFSVIENNVTFTTTLTELRKYTLYSIQVLAFTRIGDGALSVPPIYVRTFEDVPGVPSNISFPDVSTTTARILWDVPTEPNGVILAYRISYHLNSSTDSSVTKELPPTDRTLKVFNLKPETYYLFSVTAKTNEGWGKTAKALVYTTNNREAPQPPSALYIRKSQIQARQIAFSWTPGRDGFAPLRYYTVQMVEDNSVWKTLPVKVDPTVTTYTVTGLKPFTLYKFRLQATNDIGVSGWSPESDVTRTLPAAPTDAPSHVLVSPYTTTSIRVSWEPLPEFKWNGDTQTAGYRVEYCQLSAYSVSRTTDCPNSRAFGINATTLSLVDLERDNVYEIRVYAFNGQGDSPSSLPVSVFVGEAVPTGEPQDIKLESLSSTEIKVSWKPPSENEQNGDLLGYKIFYQPANNEGTDEMEAVPATTTSFVLMDLRKYCVYNIQILAFNPAGDGPRSTLQKIRTKEDVPGPPGKLIFSDITMNSLNVTWDEPAEPNGVIRGYRVVYETAVRDSDFSKQVSQKVTSNYLSVHGLGERVTYTFRVKAETYDYGPESSGNVTTGPQEGSPEAPQDFTLHHTPTSVILKWRNGASGAGPILGYIIECHQADEDEWNLLTQINNGPQSSYSISFQNLLPSTNYRLRLFARNQYGISMPSVASQPLATPSKLFLEYRQKLPFYREVWFLVMLAATSVVIIIVVIAVLCVKSKAYKYKNAQKSMQDDHLSMDDGGFATFELCQSKRGTLCKNSLSKKSNNTVITKSPPRPSPASITYSDDEDVKGYDENCDSSSLTEKPSEISSTDSQGSESDGESDTKSEPHSFVNHYANVNDTLRQSWKRQRPVKPPSYTDSEPEGSIAVSLNGGHIIMNNMAGSRAPLPGFSSFV